jgi:hypothetical protein
MATVAQADRPLDCIAKVKPNGEPRIDWRLGAALPSAHEVA